MNITDNISVEDKIKIFSFYENKLHMMADILGVNFNHYRNYYKNNLILTNPMIKIYYDLLQKRGMKTRKPIRDEIRWKMLKKYHFTCQYCGRNAPEVLLEIDHIIPISRGGGNGEENLVCACRDCNQGKKAEMIIK